MNIETLTPTCSIFLSQHCETELTLTTMPAFQMRNTVERLDKPSSYAMSKVIRVPLH